MTTRPTAAALELDLARSRYGNPLSRADRAAIERFLTSPTRANWRRVNWRTVAPTSPERASTSLLTACRTIDRAYDRACTIAHQNSDEGPIPTLQTFLLALQYATH